MVDLEGLPQTDRTLNVLAVLSVVAAVLALASMIGLGSGVPAAFAVGAGHVSLHQIGRTGDRGRSFALVGLVIGYAVALWGLILSITAVPAIVSSL